ncbi:hypothetical protein [Planomonospora algeriensis]
MLLFLKLLNMLILFAAAHAATGRHGGAIDLTDRRRIGEPRAEVVDAPADPEVKAPPRRAAPRRYDLRSRRVR